MENIYLDQLSYHKENEGHSKTFRNLRNNKWYFESELGEIIGWRNIEILKGGDGKSDKKHLRKVKFMRHRFAQEEEEGLFHEWGREYCEFEGKAKEHTVALVENKRGNISYVLPYHLTFID